MTDYLSLAHVAAATLIGSEVVGCVAYLGASKTIDPSAVTAILGAVLGIAGTAGVVKVGQAINGNGPPVSPVTVTLPPPPLEGHDH